MVRNGTLLFYLNLEDYNKMALYRNSGLLVS